MNDYQSEFEEMEIHPNKNNNNNNEVILRTAILHNSQSKIGLYNIFITLSICFTLSNISWGLSVLQMRIELSHRFCKIVLHFVPKTPSYQLQVLPAGRNKLGVPLKKSLT